MRPCALVVLALVVAAPHALAQDAPDATDARDVRVLVRLAGAMDENVTVELRADVATAVALPNGTTLALDAGGTASYAVPLTRRSGELAYVRADEALPRGAANVTVAAPDGWRGIASAGVVAFGRALDVREVDAGATRVRLAGAEEPSGDALALATDGVAYIAAQHERAPRDVLVLRVPDELADEPLVLDDALVLPAGADAETMAAGLARLHQRYRVVEVAPTSASWFREGEERMQANLALVAADLRSALEVEETFTTARAVADPDALLPQAPAGSTLSRNKGLVVVRALDAELRNASSGLVGLADLLHALDNTTGRLDSAQLEQAARVFGGEPMTTFFERYVYGAEWPATSPVRDAADVFVTSLALSPTRASPGEQVTATFSLVNRGTRASELDLVLAVDGAARATHPVRLPIGARGNGSLSLADDEPGERVVTLGAREAALRILAPARLAPVRASMTPEEPRAGEPFTLLVYVENAGEEPGRVRVEVREGDRLLQRTTEALVAGESTDALTLPLSIEEPGLHVLDITLLGDRAAGELQHTVNVALGEEARDAPGPVGLAAIFAIVAAVLVRRR